MFKRSSDGFCVDAFRLNQFDHPDWFVESCKNGLAKLKANKKDAYDPHGGINSVELKTPNGKYIPLYIGDYIVKSSNGYLIGYDALLFESVYSPVEE